MLRWKYIKAPTWKTQRDDGVDLSETGQIRITVILYCCFLEFIALANSVPEMVCRYASHFAESGFWSRV
jgi:hypothetical protein